MHVYSVKQFYSIIGSSILLFYTLCCHSGGREGAEPEGRRESSPASKEGFSRDERSQRERGAGWCACACVCHPKGCFYPAIL